MDLRIYAPSNWRMTELQYAVSPVPGLYDRLIEIVRQSSCGTPRTPPESRCERRELFPRTSAVNGGTADRDEATKVQPQAAGHLLYGPGESAKPPWWRELAKRQPAHGPDHSG